MELKVKDLYLLEYFLGKSNIHMIHKVISIYTISLDF